MIDLFNTDYKDYKDGCAALHKIHKIRVDKKKVHLCESPYLYILVDKIIHIIQIRFQKRRRLISEV